ncbi:Zinc finger, C3HC4 type (RING finger) [Musa troglodytarum]|uniref:Zinc finger, C3HC4 type (RING finger) n=1 Tax=Musa troglodytarum TaxID=320322 RepID=A0A9E7HAJ2_9LILI|nr:Zinc finger, C3HC4 type (RING finger) [Musa troglodytarum]
MQPYLQSPTLLLHKVASLNSYLFLSHDIMASGFYYFSYPTLYVLLLDLVGLVRYAIFVVSMHLGFLFRRSDAESPTGGINRPVPHMDTRPPLSPTSLKARLPVVKFESLVERWAAREEEGEHVCVICMRSFEGSHEVRELSNCAHAFHTACLDSWMDEGRWTCPLCRSYLSSS